VAGRGVGGRVRGRRGSWVCEHVGSGSHHGHGSEVSLSSSAGDSGLRRDNRRWDIGSASGSDTRHAGLVSQIASDSCSTVCRSVWGFRSIERSRIVPLAGDAHGELSSVRALHQRVWLSKVAGLRVAASRAADEVGGRIGTLQSGQ
jgi:hypothetical protein